MAEIRASNQATGAIGELVAAQHLTRRGWRILERNWRCPAGELDIVALDPTGVLVFVEVKCRRGLGYGDPLESITRAKQAKLRQLAAEWVQVHPPHRGGRRIDAIAVLLSSDSLPSVRHVSGITQ